MQPMTLVIITKRQPNLLTLHKFRGQGPMSRVG
jgi:hypothetical protein